MARRECIEHEFRATRVPFFPYEKNRNRNTKSAERAKQPLLLLTSAILNHNCPALLVRYIHRRKAPVSPPSLCPSHPSSSLIPFAVLSPSCAAALLFLPSEIPSLVLPLFRSVPPPDASPRPVGSKRSSAAAATVAIVVLVGAKLPQFCTFYTAREKKEDNFWWKRNNFIGRCYVRSVGVYCRCALHLSASCAPIRNGTNVFPNVTLIGG